MSADRDRAKQWRLKAEECRAVAEQMTNPQGRLSFCRMAETYDRLADDYEARARRERESGRKPDVG